MTWTANGAFGGQTEFTGGGTVALDNTAVGDLIALVAISVDSTLNWVTGISGGGATWAQAGSPFHGTVNGEIATAWLGTVTATGSHTATVTVTGGGPTIAIVTQEFGSSVGSWALDVVGNLDSAGTSAWPSLTPAAAGELYFGFAIDQGIAVAGSTPGWAYQVTSHQDGCAWNTSLSAPGGPAWGDSSQGFGSMFLVRETGSGAMVPGAVATSALAAAAGSVSAGASAAGAAAPIALAAPAGSVGAGATVAGPVAEQALAAPAGTVPSGAVVAGPVATSVLAAHPGTPGTMTAPQQGTVSISNTLSATVSVGNALAGSVTIVNTI